MPWAILDTNVYIGAWTRGEFDAVLTTLRQSFVVRHSAVVLSELRRGVRSADAERRLQALVRQVGRAWAPTTDDWWEAGGLIRRIGDQQSWSRERRRTFQNDALIALTARRHGATVVTSNRQDFRLLRQYLRFSLIEAA
ncbi:MAG: type II toxin-antitoxin system VapC family toxin [Deltaproteobacteria bacterium]|nr:type II toxin-antitoxin system VapC family toxin [Deltaproteobacteria bacterium]